MAGSCVSKLGYAAQLMLYCDSFYFLQPFSLESVKRGTLMIFYGKCTQKNFFKEVHVKGNLYHFCTN